MTTFDLGSAELTWRNAVNGNFWRSSYGVLAVAFNLIGITSLVSLETQGSLPAAVHILMAVVFLVLQVGLDVYAWRLCRSTRAALAAMPRGSRQEHDLLTASLRGFRWFLVGPFAYSVVATLMVHPIR